MVDYRQNQRIATQRGTHVMPLGARLLTHRPAAWSRSTSSPIAPIDAAGDDAADRPGFRRRVGAASRRRKFALVAVLEPAQILNSSPRSDAGDAASLLHRHARADVRG